MRRFRIFVGALSSLRTRTKSSLSTICAAGSSASAELSRDRNCVFAVPLPSTAPDVESPMKSYSRTHLSDRDLLLLGASRNARLRSETAAHVADIAEIERRQLYRQAGYSYMADFLEIEWKMSRDEAYKRIHAAKSALEYPLILEMLSDGRLHLTGVNFLAPHLTPANAAELLLAAPHRTKAEIEQMLAERFPRTETLPLVETHAGGTK